MNTPEATKAEPAVKVTIIVNTKPIEVVGPRLTGLQIKEAATAQGLPITVDFSLSQIKPGRPKVIGNDDIVTVNKNSEFTATSDDDDS